MKNDRIFKLIFVIGIMVLLSIPILVQGASQTQLSLAVTNAQKTYHQGDVIEVTVQLSNVQEGAELLGTVVEFDESLLKAKEVRRGFANDFARGVQPTNQIIIYQSSGLKGSSLEEGKLGSISFEVLKDVTTTTKISFGKVLLSDYDNTHELTASTNSISLSLEKKQSSSGGTHGGETPKDPEKPKEPVVSQESLPFIDVQKSDWFYEAVQYSYEKAFFKGVSATEFAPNTSMTRGMLVTVLYRMHGATETETSTFVDVPKEMYYSQPIAWASKNGIVNGIGDGCFAPDVDISREDLATIMARYLNKFQIKLATKNNSLSPYQDANLIATYAKEAINLLQEKGLMTGKENNFFDPKGKTTRAEVATLLMRLQKSRTN